MWEKFKRTLLNILFVEEEVEVEIKPKKKARKKQKKVKKIASEEELKAKQVTPFLSHKQAEDIAKIDVSTYMKQPIQSEAKVVYQYPKKNRPNISMPLVQKDNLPSTKTQRKRRRRRRQSNQGQVPTDLENIPAYIRRNRLQERVVPKEEAPLLKEETITPTPEPEVEKVDLSQTTRPEELDRLFKRIKQEAQKEVREAPADIEALARETISDVTKEVSVTPPLSEEATRREAFSGPKVDKVLLAQEDPPAEVAERETEPVDRKERHVPVRETRLEDANPPPLPSMQEQQARMTAEVTETETVEVPGHLLNDPVAATDMDEDWVIEQQILLEQTLEHFNIDAQVVNITQGPAVTRFEIQPALGVKVSRVRNLTDDFKLNMSAKDIRIEAPIPGKNTIGIEVPNRSPQTVMIQELFETEAFKTASSPLSVALGLTIEGEPMITDIGDMPHGLIAGATGSGKSVCINTILLSLLYKAHHDEVKFLLIDPKMVELAPYNGIPHLISPVITDVKAATKALKWAVEEMEDRYEQFVEARVRNIKSYNEKMTAQGSKKMPFLVIVIDELADLMMAAPQDVEDSICRIAQKARACGIHLLIATQRPSVDVVTGLIKANIPTRIAFSVSSQVDSRTMIDSVGAEKLLGKGDMLFVENGANKSLRLQGPFVSDEEIDRVAAFMRQTAEPQYLFEQEQLLLDIEEEAEDELLHEVIHFVVEKDQASTSLLQRHFRIGYNRAARLIDTLELKGIVSEQNGSKPREVLINATQLKQ